MTTLERATLTLTILVLVGSSATRAAATKVGMAPAQCGPSWSSVPSPNVGTYNNELLATSATSSTDVWAVGDYRDSGYVAHPLALHWDGQVWSVISTPEVSGVSNYLTAVNARAPDDAWAVGYDQDQGFPGGP